MAVNAVRFAVGSALGAASHIANSAGKRYNGVAQAASGLSMINNQAAANNAWSAAQAQKQMDFQVGQNKAAMEFNAAEAAKNRDWQKMMSDTAHQREVRDLQAAGLNPVLSASGGNGASVTSGATAAGVTSSGAMGQTDTSGNAALVQLLSSVLQHRTNLEVADTNAKTNLAVADKYNAMSKYLGELNAANSLQISGVQAAASRYAAGAAASASRYAADQHLAAQQFSANVQSTTSRIVAEIQAKTSDSNNWRTTQATRYAAELNKAASAYATDQNNQNKRDLQVAEQRFSEFLKRYYPENPYTIANSYLNRAVDAVPGLPDLTPDFAYRSGSGFSGFGSNSRR